ncbi:hypothetical protein PNP85_13420 [Halobacterium salinarum]|uniref:hypothetical protein n=1 Tax=Halobacterium salinarum TaxID=2242 RepID=UPI00255782E9|nr:hypothetical protein [Halobacterium salinarum]MDL0137310.1 hypothetical protein [Halobacterium salinarum]MDL0140503.1 hypothetical protein [Halobacterium salinarum]
MAESDYVERVNTQLEDDGWTTSVATLNENTALIRGKRASNGGETHLTLAADHSDPLPAKHVKFLLKKADEYSVSEAAVAAKSGLTTDAAQLQTEYDLTHLEITTTARSPSPQGEAAESDSDSADSSTRGDTTDAPATNSTTPSESQTDTDGWVQETGADDESSRLPDGVTTRRALLAGGVVIGGVAIGSVTGLVDVGSNSAPFAGSVAGPYLWEREYEENLVYSELTLTGKPKDWPTVSGLGRTYRGFTSRISAGKNGDLQKAKLISKSETLGWTTSTSWILAKASFTNDGTETVKIALGPTSELDAGTTFVFYVHNPDRGKSHQVASLTYSGNPEARPVTEK